MATLRTTKNKKNNDSSAAKQERRKLRLGIWLLAGVVVALLLVITAVWWLHQRLYSRNPRLTLKVVHVSSSGYWGQGEEIRNQLIRELKLNMHYDNVLALDLRKLREDIKKIPNIADAQVNVILPDTLSIAINERVPKAFLGVRDGEWVVDANGWVMNRKQCFWVSDKLPVIEISGKTAREIKVGTPLQAISEQLKLLAAIQNTVCFTVRSITPFRGNLMAAEMLYHGKAGKKEFLIRFPAGDYPALLEQARKDIETGIVRSDKISEITLSNKGISVLSE